MATTKLTKINLQKAGADRVKDNAAPEGGVTEDQNPDANEGEETMDVPPPAGTVGGSDPSQTSAITDPMELRQTNTNKLQRIKADETTAAVPHGREEGTDTVRLKVVREKKKQLPDVVSPGQTVHLRPSAAPEAAGGQERSASATIKAAPAAAAAAATPTGVLKIISKPKAAPRGGKLIDDESDKAVTRTLRIQPGQGVAAAPPMEAPKVSPESDTAPALAPTAEKISADTDTKARADMKLDDAAGAETVVSQSPIAPSAATGTESKKLALRKAGGAPAAEIKPKGVPLRPGDSGRVPLRPTPVATDETTETTAAELEAEAEGVSTTQSTVVATPAEVDGKTGKLSLKLKKGPESAGATVAAAPPPEEEQPETEEVGQGTQVEPSAKRTVAVAAPAAVASETIQIPPEEAEAAAAGAGEKKKVGLRLKTAKKEAAPAEAAATAEGAPAAEAAVAPARRAAAMAASAKSELGVVSFLAAAAAVVSLGALTAVLVKQVLDHCM